jgi:hypothetical protein
MTAVLSELRGALWALTALHRARRQLRAGALETVEIPQPPRLAPAGASGVRAVLQRRSHTCLERAIVLQRWEAVHGRPRDVVIGVRGPSGSFEAHAWLDGVEPAPAEYRELTRIHA